VDAIFGRRRMRAEGHAELELARLEPALPNELCRQADRTMRTELEDEPIVGFAVQVVPFVAQEATADRQVHDLEAARDAVLVPQQRAATYADPK
jgi:hypothetical protein